MKKILLTCAIVIAIAISMVIYTFAFGVGAMFFPERDKTTNIVNYNKYFGENGKHRNDIFPNMIPTSAKVEDFCYYYYNPFDPNYVSYLVYSCNDEDFNNETERLSKLTSSKDYLIYGATGFNYPVCAVYADNYKGYIYALADKENNKLIYVEIDFCNYFSDINYENIISKDYLPIDFNAKKDNATKQEFHKSISENFGCYIINP